MCSWTSTWYSDRKGAAGADVGKGEGEAGGAGANESACADVRERSGATAGADEHFGGANWVVLFLKDVAKHDDLLLLFLKD